MPVTRARGEVVAADVPAARPQLAPLLRAGATLSDGLVNGLRSAGVHHVWVQDDRAHPVQLLAPEVRLSASAKLQRTFAAVAAGGGLDQAAHDALDDVVEVVLDLLALPSSAPVLLDVAPDAAFDARHALGTCALGLLIATHLIATDGPWAAWMGAHRPGGTDAGLGQLGVGLLLCDIGRHVRGAAPEEWVEVAGQLLEERSPFVLGTVLGHEQRFDAPGGVPPAFARIAAVADVVDARIRRGGHDELAPQAEALVWAVGQSGGAFDPAVVRALLEVVTPHPPGTCVEIDGELGVVVEVDPHDHTKSRVALPDGSVVDHAAIGLLPAAA